MKIKIDKVKGYEFEGHVLLDDLTDNQLKTLHINRLTHNSDEIQVIGAFDVYASNYDDCGIDSIEYVTLLGAQDGGTVYAPTGKVSKWVDERGLTNVKTIYDNVPTQYTIELDESQYDSDDLSEQILDHSDTSEWVQDRNETMADYYHDMIKDGDY